jgi:hypothetical protein
MVLDRRKYSYRYEARNGAGQKEIFIQIWSTEWCWTEGNIHIDMKHGMVLDRRKYSHRYEARNGAGQKEIFIQIWSTEWCWTEGNIHTDMKHGMVLDRRKHSHISPSTEVFYTWFSVTKVEIHIPAHVLRQICPSDIIQAFIFEVSFLTILLQKHPWFQRAV